MFNSPNYKKYNVIAYSIIGSAQFLRWILKTKGENFNVGSIKEQTKLKNIDSYGFWAILTNDEETIYMKKLNVTDIPLSLSDYKNQPYLIKKKILNAFKGDNEIGAEPIWERRDLSSKTLDNSHNYGNAGRYVLYIFFLGCMYTLSSSLIRYAKLMKTRDCLSFIKSSCKNDPGVVSKIGNSVKIRNIDGTIHQNYFDGTIFLSGTSDIRVRLTIYKNNACSKFELVKLTVVE